MTVSLTLRVNISIPFSSMSRMPILLDSRKRLCAVSNEKRVSAGASLLSEGDSYLEACKRLLVRTLAPDICLELLDILDLQAGELHTDMEDILRKAF